jgi:hypothetical protein
MATSSDVMSMIYPDGGWVTVGDDFEGIQFLECQPITLSTYQKSANEFDQWKAKQKADKETAKQAAYAKLGLTADEVDALFG